MNLTSRWGAALILLGAQACAGAPSSEGIAFFESKVRPLLAEHCYECHSSQAKKLKGGLRLDVQEGWQRGGDSGEPAIVPHQPGKSPLIAAVRQLDRETAMPPKSKLTEREIADLTAWVAMGAPDPRTGDAQPATRGSKAWWSFQPLATTNPPSPAGLPSQWQSSAIDRFIFEALVAKGLLPNPPADPKSLIRRMTYDVTGLPPTTEEVAAFDAASKQDCDAATAALVDRLLASPRYGEQWGRHWLDVARFGESTGFERNIIIDDAWPYRDYVIASFNDDKPYNQFVVEQLAGDVVGKGQPSVEVATAFLVGGPYDNVGNQDPVAAAQIRANTVDEMITATGTAFLGVSINCARCHHHKFDPIPQEDYYRIYAALKGVQHGRRAIAPQEETRRFEEAVNLLKARKEAAASQLEKLKAVVVARAAAAEEERSTVLQAAPLPELTEEMFAPIDARFVRLKMLGTSEDPASGNGARIDEFELWTAGPASHNVALAAAGGTATGAASSKGGDLGKASTSALVNDGKFGQRWFAGAPAELTIELAKSERVERVSFSNLRGTTAGKAGGLLGPYAVEYSVLVSGDGKRWTEVANSLARAAISDAHLRARRLRTAMLPEEAARTALLAAEIAKADAELQAVPPLPQVWAGQFVTSSAPTYVHLGGDPAKPGAVVLPASLALLEGVAPAFSLAADSEESQRRLALARWITSDQNPLTARVIANRLWHYHFGTGLVDTPSDFGFLGGQPSHPALLDWLALRLQQQGWRLKALHREILLSQTYRQSGAARPEAVRLDKEARLLWRFPPRRLTGEEVRDTMLTVAGQLDLKMGGPGFRLYQYVQDNVATYLPLDHPGPETYRRSVYHQSARASVVDLLSDFDAPDPASAAPRRAGTTSPLQALTLLNHSFTLDMAAALASRLEKEAGPDADAELRRAFALTFLREPTAREEEASRQMIVAHGLKAFCRALLNTSELLYLD